MFNGTKQLYVCQQFLKVARGSFKELTQLLQQTFTKFDQSSYL
jgi:hypothetical protein